MHAHDRVRKADAGLMQRTRSQPAGPAAGRCPDAGASDLEAREGVAEMWAGPKDGSKESGRVREEPRRPHPGWDWPDALHVHNLHRRAHATLRSGTGAMRVLRPLLLLLPLLV